MLGRTARVRTLRFVLLAAVALSAAAAWAVPAEAPTSSTLRAAAGALRATPAAPTAIRAGAAQAYRGWLSEVALADFVVLGTIILLAYGAGRILRLALRRWAVRLEERRREILAETCGSLGRSLPLPIFVWGLRVGLSCIAMPMGAWLTVLPYLNAATGAAVGLVLFRLVDVVHLWVTVQARKSHNRLDDMLVPIVRASLRVTVAVLTIVQVAQALSDKPITSIIAGLGIGGIAVALAAQDSVRNFFGSLLIFFDKPFTVGDRVVVDAHDGSVEEVGLRSTRIRTADGHLVSIPNGELANKVIRNVGRRPFVRRAFQLDIPYDTPRPLVERALAILREILANHEGMRPEHPPRVHLRDLATAALVIEIVYWYYPGDDHWAYMAFSEKINFEILRRFEEAGIQLAYPGRPARPAAAGK